MLGGGSGKFFLVEQEDELRFSCAEWLTDGGLVSTQTGEIARLASADAGLWSR